MAKNLILVALFLVLNLFAIVNSEKQMYIVYMGNKVHEDHNVVHEYVHNFLADAIGSSREEAQKHMIHTYKRSFTGFSAMLTEEQAAHISSKEGVVSVFRSKTHRVHTTNSWKFMDSLADSARRFSNHSQYPVTRRLSNYSSHDVIVGVLDTGIWPESKSFSDDGMPPVPSRWKGACVAGEQFSLKTCNRKMIGARYYTSLYDSSKPKVQERDIRSARDSDGHGTHVASTVAGNIVEGVSFPGGIASGIARGGSPNSRIAVYKVCWQPGCSDADILAGFDDAIDDGVDILSVSLGSILSPRRNSKKARLEEFTSSIHIGALQATFKNILVSAAGGNDGPTNSAIGNDAPWILTAAASSTDRKLESSVVLGNESILQGQGINPSDSKVFPLALGSSLAAHGVSSTNASFCLPGTLDASKTKGKIVICQFGLMITRVGILASEAGVILVDNKTLLNPENARLPSTIMTRKSGVLLNEYLNNERHPVAKFLKTETILHDKPSPTVAAFSSRGPSIVTPDIIKPDITAPGVTILAASSPVSAHNYQRVNYRFESGTSMACPHITGVAALLKGLHPTWTPAMIKSAIMTTAITVDNTNKPIKNAQTPGDVATPFDFGSGHVNPDAAADPGLVYDTSIEEYISFFCGVSASLGNPLSSCRKNETLVPFNLNYPSIGVSRLKGKVSITRTVTNVGPAVSSYKVKVSPPPGVSVTVSPLELKFTRRMEKRSFTVELKTGTRHDVNKCLWIHCLE